jgi:hypothetical protein
MSKDGILFHGKTMKFENDDYCLALGSRFKVQSQVEYCNPPLLLTLLFLVVHLSKMWEAFPVEKYPDATCSGAHWRKTLSVSNLRQRLQSGWKYDKT